MVVSDAQTSCDHIARETCVTACGGVGRSSYSRLGAGVGQSAWSALLSVARGGGQSAVARGCINTKSHDSIHLG